MTVAFFQCEVRIEQHYHFSKEDVSHAVLDLGPGLRDRGAASGNDARIRVGRSRHRTPGTYSGVVPAGVHARAYPRLNVGEDAERFYIEALAPGVAPGTLEITVEKNTIRIAGQKRGAANDVPAEAYHRSERAVGKFARALALPSDIDAGKVTAEYDNGLLLVTAPKAEAVKPKRIKVRAA